MEIFGIDFNQPDVPLNDYFKMNDIGSRLSLKNLGSSFFFIIIYIFIWIAFFIMKYMLASFKR
jgi:hypothetical protein